MEYTGLYQSENQYYRNSFRYGFDFIHYCKSIFNYLWFSIGTQCNILFIFSFNKMVGFSNGAITIGVLLSNHDEFILTHFRKFCLVDHGMFHLTDLHKSRARDCRFLILVGDQEDFGRDLKIRQTQLQQESWQLLGVDFASRIMKNTGHEFNAPQMELVSEWLRSEPANAPKSVNSTNRPRP